MQINIRISGMVLLVIALALAAIWFEHGRKSQNNIETTVDAWGAPVPMRTRGGLLEISTVKAHERFTRSDTKDFWGIPLGTTISQIELIATYHYQIEMAKEWPMFIKGKTCLVQAGPVKPALPVAFDTATMTKFTASGWARFNKGQNLTALEKELTPRLQIRADGYRQLAVDFGRQTIAEFVTIWLLKEQHWKRDPEYKVLVVFPGEKWPTLAP